MGSMKKWSFVAASSVILLGGGFFGCSGGGTFGSNILQVAVALIDIVAGALVGTALSGAGINLGT